MRQNHLKTFLFAALTYAIKTEVPYNSTFNHLGEFAWTETDLRWVQGALSIHGDKLKELAGFKEDLFLAGHVRSSPQRSAVESNLT